MKLSDEIKDRMKSAVRYGADEAFDAYDAILDKVVALEEVVDDIEKAARNVDRMSVLGSYYQGVSDTLHRLLKKAGRE